MELLEKNISPDIISMMKLESIPTQIIDQQKFKTALETLNPEKLVDQNNTRIKETIHENKGSKQYTKIKNSWIYTHFTRPETKDTKIAVYVNTLLPINQNLDDYKEIESVANHSVIAKGITTWENDNHEMIECLELEIHDGSNQDRFIPVEFPFFEEVQVKIKKIFFCNEGSDTQKRPLNKYGTELAKIKWGQKLETEWYNVRKELKPSAKNDEEDNQYKNLKYQMLFVRAIRPCFQLKFTS